MQEYLYFPPDAKGMRTRFREMVLNYIYRTALGLCGGRLRSAAVSIASEPDEEDSATLDLTLTVEADWEVIRKLRYDILVRVTEWSLEWSDEDKEDYSRRIYFSFLTTQL